MVVQTSFAYNCTTNAGTATRIFCHDTFCPSATKTPLYHPSMMKFLHVAVLAAIFVKCVSASAFSETDPGKAIKEGRLGIAGSINQTGRVDMWTLKNFVAKDQ